MTSDALGKEKINVSHKLNLTSDWKNLLVTKRKKNKPGVNGYLNTNQWTYLKPGYA